MKLASYVTPASKVVMGALVNTAEGEKLLNLHAAFDACEPGAVGRSPGSPLGSDLFEFVQGGERSLCAARDAMTWARHQAGVDPAALAVMLDVPQSVRFLPPITRPRKMIAIGANYPAHVQEIGDRNMDAAVAAIGKNLSSGEYPPAFPKLPSSLAGHGQDIPYPRFTQQLDYEAELAFVIGRDCCDVAEKDALECIAGFMISNDVSARDIQFKEMKRGLLLLGKNFEASAPMGPYFVTRDEVRDWQSIEIRCWVNGQLRQHDVAGRMIYSIPQALAYYSKMPLEAGDIFLTGSPAGVAIGMDAPEKHLLRPGDVVEIEMTGLGRLVNRIGESR
jgi:2-keto-4-pentenoate hydratase/2-oxohepta-3-ene-1,7-dioic acid hydratase in catechol pathway